MARRTPANDIKKPLTRLQFLFLMIIFQSEGYISVEQILQTIQTHLPEHVPSTGAIYKTLNALTERNLIKKKVQEDDKRIKHYRMTRKGAEVLREIYLRQLKFLQFMQKYCASCSTKKQSNPKKK